MTDAIRDARGDAMTDRLASAGTDADHLLVRPSPELGAIIGMAPLPRGEVLGKIWDYIKRNDLQDPADKREILPDEPLKRVIGRDRCTMFDMTGYVLAHVKA